MTAQFVQRVASQRVIPVKSLADIPTKFLIPEIRSITTQWALEEHRVQTRLSPPNQASAVILDGRTPLDVTTSESKRLAGLATRPGEFIFPGMKRKIRWVYTDLETLVKAVGDGYRQVIDMTARASGHTIRTYYFWVSDPDNPGRDTELRNLGDVEKWIRASSSNGIRIALLGPTNEDRRFRIYNPRGVRQTSKWISPSHAQNDPPATSRYKFLKPRESHVAKGLYSRGRGVVLRAIKSRSRPKYSAGVAVAIQETVMRKIRRSYRDIGCYYRFVPNRGAMEQRKPTPKYGVHIPELVFRMKRGYRSGPRRLN